MPESTRMLKMVSGYTFLAKSCVISLHCAETKVEIMDSIRGRDVFILQTGFSGKDSSVNDSIMELLIMCYACKTSSARKVIGTY